MSTENFNYIEYSDEKLFTSTPDGKIELKEYTDDLLFYTSFDSTLDAIYSEGDATATVSGTVTNEINGVFGQTALFNPGSLKYNKVNFVDLNSEGNIQFRIKPNFITGKGYQYFNGITNPVITTVPDLTTDEQRFGGASLYMVGTQQKNLAYNTTNLSSMVQEGTIELSVKLIEVPPTTNNMLFMVGNAANNNNLIAVTYNTDGKIYFTVHDQTGVQIVNVNFAWVPDGEWHDFSFNFDLNAGSSQVFVDGIENGVEDTSTGTRVDSIDTFIVGSDTGYITNFYLDAFSAFDVKQRSANYDPSTISLVGDEADLIVLAKYDITLDLDTGVDLVYSSTVPANNDYSFNLTVDAVLETIDVTLESSDTLLDISNKISVLLTDAGSAIVDDKIRITADADGAPILIEEPTAGTSMLTLLSGVGDTIMPNAPTADVTLIDLYNDTNNNNRVQLIHNTDSEIVLKMYDASGVEKINIVLFQWNNFSIDWYTFDFSWNETIGQFFLDGELKSVFVTGFIRTADCYLNISSGTTSYYFDEFIVNKLYGNTANFAVPTSAQTPYATSDPWIDIHFGDGFRENEVIGLNLVSSLNLGFVVKLGNIWYYYLSGSWRESDGTFSQSVTPSILETKFAELYFDENNPIVIRAFFSSDGITNEWVDSISIEAIIGEEAPAIIVGTIDLTNPVDLSVNSHVVITTDQGTLEVDMASEAGDISAVTLEEIKAAVDAAAVPGLAPAADENNHLVIMSLNSGSDAYVSISNGITTDALATVWGYEATDSGEEATGDYFDYTEISRWIRSRLGGGVVPVELTDEQIEDCVAEAVHLYNYYRNVKEEVIKVYLSGNDQDGYTIPPEVGGEENIIEIIMKPRFPFAYHSGGGVDSFMGNLYLQWFYNTHQSSGFQGILGDYYIALSTQKDAENILGTSVKWEFFNGKIYLSPIPTSNLLVGIKFRSSLTIAEINTNMLIKRYSLAMCKQVLGTIRSTFGGTIPGGAEMITLRGESMIAEGKEEEQKNFDLFQKLAEPMFLDWF